ncbi:L-threonylcarbamoyladenylate synthase [Thermodesulfobacteriota bacterium]
MRIAERRPEVIKTDPEGNFDDAVKRAAEILLAGGLVAYPTESFYGLAVDATNEGAIAQLFKIKGRDPGQPILLLIQSKEIPENWVCQIPTIAQELIEKYWPGGLTLVFEAGPAVSPLLTAGTGKIGIRCSSHPMARALAREVAVPITGTSANVSGKSPCGSAEEVIEALGGGVGLVLDGGRTQGQKASTILDVTVEPPRILRQGLLEPVF